jgi:hypothetical protein
VKKTRRDIKVESGSDFVGTGKAVSPAFACGVLARIQRLGIAAIAGFISQAAADGWAQRQGIHFMGEDGWS